MEKEILTSKSNCAGENFLLLIANALDAESAGESFGFDDFASGGSAGMCAYSLLRELSIAINTATENVREATNKVNAFRESVAIWTERAERTANSLLTKKMDIDPGDSAVAMLQAYRAHSELEATKDLLNWWEDRLRLEEQRCDRLKRQEKVLHALCVTLTPPKEG